MSGKRKAFWSGIGLAILGAILGPIALSREEWAGLGGWLADVFAAIWPTAGWIGGIVGALWLGFKIGQASTQPATTQPTRHWITRGEAENMLRGSNFWSKLERLHAGAGPAPYPLNVDAILQLFWDAFPDGVQNDQYYGPTLHDWLIDNARRIWIGSNGP